jgi:hypothetical protein
MSHSQIIVIVVGSLVGILQALILYVLKDFKTNLSKMVRSDLCEERRKNLEKWIENLEKSLDE